MKRYVYYVGYWITAILAVAVAVLIVRINFSGAPFLVVWAVAFGGLMVVSLAGLRLPPPWPPRHIALVNGREGETGNMNGGAMRTINLTPHPVRVWSDDGPDRSLVVELPPSDETARLAERATPDGSVEVQGTKIPAHRVDYGAVEGLPEPMPGTRYVVPLMVALVLRDRRDDLLYPYGQTRNDEGSVDGCLGFGSVA